MAEHHYQTGPLQGDGLRPLEVKILNALNGGSSLLPGGVFGFTDAANGAPTTTPTTSAAIAVNSFNGRQWQWYSGAWH